MKRQLIAPEGFGSLTSQRTYHYLGRFGEKAWVVLAFFERGHAHIERLTNAEFESALAAHVLVAADPQRDYPPAFDRFFDGACDKSADFEEYKRKYSQSVTKRYQLIAPYLARVGEAFCAKKPNAVLTRYARACVPPQNPLRFRNWLLLTLAYGTQWALLPRFCENGRYERKEAGRKLGRPAKAGRRTGYRSTPAMATRIIEGFERRRSGLSSLTAIYRAVLLKDFGCLTRQIGGRCEFHHPDGAPWPSYRQFRYALLKRFTPQELLTKTRGRMDAREKMWLSYVSCGQGYRPV